MPLSAHRLRTETVALRDDNSFEVRGITFPDLEHIMRGRRDDLMAIVTKYQEIKQGSTNDIGQLGMMVARDFPMLAMEIVSACVVGEPMDEDARTILFALPFPTQLDALLKVARLTVEESGGLGNLMADVRKRLAEMGEVRRPISGMTNPTA